jgi:ATP-binding cassette, subfamily B, bacterial
LSARDLDALTWPASQLGDAIDVLCRKAAIGPGGREVQNPPKNFDESTAGDWIGRCAAALDCEAEPVVTTFGELEQELESAYPAILRLSPYRFLIILSAKRGRARVITPNLKVRTVAVSEISRVLAGSLMTGQRDQIESLLNGASIRASGREAALRLLLAEHLNSKRFDQLWLLRVAPGASVRLWLRQANAFGNGGAILAAHTGQYLLWIASWALIGQLSLNGQLSEGWLIAWGLLLLTLVPLRLLTVWKQGLLAVGLGGMLKARLLHGALRLEPDELRSAGIGSFLSQAFEAETVETLALSGGIEGILALIELIAAGFILGWLGCALLVCFIATLFLARWFAGRYSSWTAARFDMTHDIIEAMVGHRTRLVQQPEEEWHLSEDQTLNHYLDRSEKVDRAGTWLMAAVPRAWLIVGLAFLSPVVIVGRDSVSAMAASLGAILLAYNALRRLAGSFSEIAAVWSAWKRVVSLFNSASRPENHGTISLPALDNAPDNQHLIEADGLSFRYRADRTAVLKACTLSIHRGDRILLEGPSGGGKTTFASLLTGMRQPDSGLLLMNGLDRRTVGDMLWRRRLVAAPQFHENHILTETLAFNLLMGRRWPPTMKDLEDAETVCRELGLGNLLDTMPAGLMQMVGEGGWQLSHGERSRVFIARALLEEAELVVLDESFAALDPENLKTALECTLAKANTLLVIAHP